MGELWKQCGAWLVRLDVLPSTHRISWPDATVQDLAYALRDGVLLCHLLHTIDNTTLDMKQVNQRPALAQFLCLKNIRLFLAACTGYFEMRETDLFQPSMLYDYSDFAQVLHTLSRLSQTPRALASGQQGFPPSQAQGPTQDEEEIYRGLEDLVNEDQYTDFYQKHLGGGNFGRRSSNYFAGAEKEEDIYEDLCSFNSRNKQLHSEIQSLQPKEKRDFILKELLETESNYVDVLNMLRKHFIRPIVSIKDADKKVIFMNIKELGESHGGFYKDILESVTGKSRKRVGEVFLEYKERFLKYGDYCAQLTRATQLLESLTSKDEAVREEVALCEQTAGKFKLTDLLTVPMQRILKYHLLLQRLLQQTLPAHEEYHSIQQAYEAMLDVSEFINEVKRDSEQLEAIKKIQVSITDWNIADINMELRDYGRLRKDSELKIQSHDNASKTKVRYVFVFDKMLLICKSTRGEHYSFKDGLKVADYKVQDVSSRRLSRDTRWAHSFLLVHKDNLHAYTLFARTEDDKNKWIEAINVALSNEVPSQRLSSTHDAVMATFDRPTPCQYCHKLLKGLFYQGYSCQKCHRAMHKECIPLLSKCGPNAAPPSLPPRPPSMQLPSATGGHDTLHRLSSTLSLVEPETPALPMPPPLTMATMSLPPGPDYVNTRIEEHAWAVGEMGRDAANTLLLQYPVGTYLVRTRLGADPRRATGDQLGHALSLRTTSDTKHMKINTSEPEEGCGAKFFLSEARTFRSVVELVSWYSHHSLKESFSGLDMTLKFPYRDITLARANHDFTPDQKESNMLYFRSGEVLAVIDRMGDSVGWWKAIKDNKIGYIPRDFVSTL